MLQLKYFVYVCYLCMYVCARVVCVCIFKYFKQSLCPHKFWAKPQIVTSVSILSQNGKPLLMRQVNPTVLKGSIIQTWKPVILHKFSSTEEEILFQVKMAMSPFSAFNGKILNPESYAVILCSVVPVCPSELLFDSLSRNFWGSFVLCAGFHAEICVFITPICILAFPKSSSSLPWSKCQANKYMLVFTLVGEEENI